MATSNADKDLWRGRLSSHADVLKKQYDLLLYGESTDVAYADSGVFRSNGYSKLISGGANGKTCHRCAAACCAVSGGSQRWKLGIN